MLNKNKVVYFFATGFGSGYLPLMPGTSGSFVAAIIFWFLPFDNLSLIVLSVFVFIMGLYAASYVEKIEGKDAGLIVIDEFVGQWMTYLFLPKTLIMLVLGFVVFRVLDILKPFPANVSQNLKGGLGIMIDDVIVGVYANILLQIYNLWIF